MRLNGTGIFVDELSDSGAPCLITHYHADHLEGLHRWNGRSRIFCTETTAQLLMQLDGLPADVFHLVAVDTEFDLKTANGAARVRVLDANHCPGAVMFHIQTRQRRILYTGDFRLNDAIRARCRELARPDLLYVDATYAHPRYRFPPQEQAIGEVLALIRSRWDAAEICLAVYTIGKSKLLQAICDEFGLPFYAPEQMRRAYEAIGISHLVTRDKHSTRFRAYARGYFDKYFRLSARYQSPHVAVIIPTGWALDLEARDPAYHYVAYSEHCDYQELQEFKALVQARKVIPMGA